MEVVFRVEHDLPIDVDVHGSDTQPGVPDANDVVGSSALGQGDPQSPPGTEHVPTEGNPASKCQQTPQHPCYLAHPPSSGKVDSSIRAGSSGTSRLQRSAHESTELDGRSRGGPH